MVGGTVLQGLKKGREGKVFEWQLFIWARLIIQKPTEGPVSRYDLFVVFT